MLGDLPVVDAVVHPYDLGDSNRDDQAQTQLDAVYAAHCISVGGDFPQKLTHDEFFSDFSYEALDDALFRESEVDLAVIHALPNLGFALGDVTNVDRAARWRDKNPERYRLYAAVDTPIVASAVSQLERQVTEIGVDGLKLYPAFFLNRTATAWRLDGNDFATPLLSAARDMGIKNVAIHKVLFLPPAPRDAFSIDDMDGALERFRDINFQIVHAGVTFLERTCEMLARHPNVYATLESTFSYVATRPDVFGNALAAMIAAAGTKRLMFGSGANLMHPQPLLDAFRDFEFSEELLNRYEIDQLSDDARADILGGNAIRINSIDREELVTSSRRRQPAETKDLQAPWSGLRGTIDRSTTAASW